MGDSVVVGDNVRLGVAVPRVVGVQVGVAIDERVIVGVLEAAT